jgi:hypothetical protein
VFCSIPTKALVSSSVKPNRFRVRFFGGSTGCLNVLGHWVQLRDSRVVGLRPS